MKKKLSGSCACGAVRFEVQPPAKFVVHCHCNNCRRAHGAGFVTWAGFPKGQFELTAGQETICEFHTDTDAVRSFCRTCGTPMLYASLRWPGETHVAVALIDGDLQQLPTASVYADRAPAWCLPPGNIPHLGGESGMDSI